VLNGKCGIVSQDVIERILRHLGLWQEVVPVHRGLTRRAKRPLIHGSTTPLPDYGTEPVMAFFAT
jgi:hypothetical protein